MWDPKKITMRSKIHHPSISRLALAILRVNKFSRARGSDYRGAGVSGSDGPDKI